MATTLKSYLTANIGTSPTTVYNPTASGIQSTVIGMLLVNTTTSNVSISVTYALGANTVYLAKNLTLITNNTLDLLGGSKLIVEQNGVIQITSSAATSVDAVLSVVEVV